jgi:ABC-2 type transport system permease protein
VSDLGLALRQIRFTNRAWWRNPASAFFTFAFPLLFLVIFTALLGNGTTPFGAVEIRNSTYYVAAMAAFGVISATYTNIAISVSFQRDAGILKRLRGTPLPPWAYLFGRIVQGMFVGGILVVLTVAFGVVAYGASIPTGFSLVEFIATFLVGSLSFAAMALAVTTIIPNADAAPPIVNATILPLLFLSGIFIPLGDEAPEWMRTVANAFPVKPFADALFGSAFSDVAVQTPGGTVFPFTFAWSDLLVVAAWGVAGLVVAARFFSWEPRK